ncbi:MAG: ABC transporter permease [Clostridia bacterium]|nr:ABC transporter permease [Clostridia bacterium]
MNDQKATSLREPLFHLTKRASISSAVAWLIRLAAVIIGLAVSGLIAFLLIEKLRLNPKEGIAKFYRCFYEGIWTEGKPFWENRSIWKFLKDTAMLLCIALAVTPAFKMKFWNTGAEGQTLMGILGAITVAVWLVPQARNASMSVPYWTLQLLMFGAAVLASTVWALIPAIFKAVWNTNETLFTLMMNYVAMNLVNMMLFIWRPKDFTLPSMNFDKLSFQFENLKSFVNNYLVIVLAVLALTFILFIYLKYTKHGYEISVVGESVRTAQYSGISVKKVIIRTMIVSGILCGVAGFLFASGLNKTIKPDDVGGNGFTAILVSWLAKFNPFGMIVTSALITVLNLGSAEISSDFDVSSAFPNVLVGIILFFVIGCEFFINYKIVFRKRSNRVKGASIK